MSQTFIIIFKWSTIKHKYLEIKIKGSVQRTPFWYTLYVFYDHRLNDLFLLILNVIAHYKLFLLCVQIIIFHWFKNVLISHIS
jgi:hypothetical protein